MIKKLFVLSSAAGKKDFDKFEKEIIDCYKKNNRLDELEIVKTKSKKDLEDSCIKFLNRDFPNFDKKIIYACGGDGSLSEIANIIASSENKAGLGLIPMGTANDFSKIFDYSNFSLEDTFEPKLSKIDLIKINDRYSINIFSTGFDAKVLDQALRLLDKYPSLSSFAYALAVLKIIFKIKASKLKISFLDENDSKIEKENSYIFATVCNGSYYGSGFNPAPDAKIDDGFLNLLLVNDTNLLNIIPLIRKYKKGSHLTSKYVNYYLVKSGQISSDEEMLINIDGYIIKDKNISFEVAEAALDFHIIK